MYPLRGFPGGGHRAENIHTSWPILSDEAMGTHGAGKPQNGGEGTNYWGYPSGGLGSLLFDRRFIVTALRFISPKINRLGADPGP